MDGRDNEADEEGTCRTESQRADTDGTDRGPQRNDDKQCEQG